MSLKIDILVAIDFIGCQLEKISSFPPYKVSLMKEILLISCKGSKSKWPRPSWFSFKLHGITNASGGTWVVSMLKKNDFMRLQQETASVILLNTCSRISNGNLI